MIFGKLDVVEYFVARGWESAISLFKSVAIQDLVTPPLLEQEPFGLRSQRVVISDQFVLDPIEIALRGQGDQMVAHVG